MALVSGEELLAERERLLAMLHEASEIITWSAPDKSHPNFLTMEARINRFLRDYDDYLNEVS